MSDNIAISVVSVGKTYRIWESPSARLTAPLIDGLAECLPESAVARGLRQFASRQYRDFQALGDVSLEVRKGESVGIIGRNGSGKSTLLQIIAGTLQPTSGKVRIQGRVAALLELGAGFNPEFTGRENVFLNAAVLGISKAETEARFPEIAAFAEIGDFMDQPIKTYSSGMLVRLAFATQTVIEPEILIVDEALSVGDFFFQQKCFKRIAELRARGTTILFVSHDMGSVRDLCSRTLYLRRGRAVEYGESQHVISLYLREDSAGPAPVDAAPAPAAEVEAKPEPISFRLDEPLQGALWVNPEPGRSDPASVQAEILSVRVLDRERRPSTSLPMGSQAVIQAFVLAQTAESLHCAVELKNRHGQVVASLGTRTSRLAPLTVKRGDLLTFEATVDLGLEAGEYALQAVVGLLTEQANAGIRVHASPWLGPITINWNYERDPAPFLGMFQLPAKIRFEICQPGKAP